jgi:hypothetical protein
LTLELKGPRRALLISAGGPLENIDPFGWAETYAVAARSQHRSAMGTR